MIETKIEWATDTVNWWHGCTKVSPACEHCYAETLDARFHGVGHNIGMPGFPQHPSAEHWGKNAPRLLRVPQALEELRKIRRRAINGVWRCTSCAKRATYFMRNGEMLPCQACGGQLVHVHERPRVFINSMSDFFEDRRDLDAPRLAALDAMRQAPEVDFLLLTKRTEAIKELLNKAWVRAHQWAGTGLPELAGWINDWLEGRAPRNIWLGTTAENQEWADKRIPELLNVPAAIRFLSCEPLLGPINLAIGDTQADAIRRRIRGEGYIRHFIHWVIVGGESGSHARPMQEAWASSLLGQCRAAGVPFFMKQMGGTRDKRGDLESIPEGLRVREVPDAS